MTYTRACHFRAGEAGFHPTHDVWIHTYERLRQQYGHARAQAKLRGEDSDSQADEAAWKRLGRGRGR